MILKLYLKPSTTGWILLERSTLRNRICMLSWKNLKRQT